MDNAIGLFAWLPIWYFESIANPLALGPISMFSATGVVSLAIAVMIASEKREVNLFWLFVPVAISHVLVTAAGFLLGVVDRPWPFLNGFLVVQAGLAVFTIYRCTRSRLAGVFGSWFSFTYALVAAIISAMALANSWI